MTLTSERSGIVLFPFGVPLRLGRFIRLSVSCELTKLSEFEPQGAKQMAASAATRTPNLHRANPSLTRSAGDNAH